jgi:hypothetical protein
LDGLTPFIQRHTINITARVRALARFQCHLTTTSCIFRFSAR